MPITLRPATVDDALTIYDITRQSFAEYRGRLDPPSGAERETLEDVLLSLRHGAAVLAALDGEVAGCVRYRPEDGGFYVARLAVQPAMRRQGIGSALLACVEAEARAAGAPRLRLRVRLSLPENVRLYTRFGYRVSGLHPLGAQDVGLTMVKELAPRSRDHVMDVIAPLLPELQQLELSCRAVLLFGSHAHGSPGPFSDLDLCIVTEQPPLVPDRLRLLPFRDSQLAVSIHARCLRDIAQEAADPDAWPLVRDIYAEALVLSGPDAVLAEIRNCVDERRPDAALLWRTAQHDILSLLEGLGKAKNAAARLDAAGLSNGAARVAAAAARLLRPLNPPWHALEREHLAAAFSAWRVAPPGAGRDAALCLGCEVGEDPPSPPLLAALRLAAGTLDLLAPYADRLPLSADLRAMLSDGSLLNLARQEFGCVSLAGPQRIAPA